MSKEYFICRMKVQRILNENTSVACGDFHTNEFNEDSFVSEITKSFRITSKTGGNIEELLKNTIKNCTSKARGRFISSKELKHTKFLKELFENFELKLQ